MERIIKEILEDILKKEVECNGDLTDQGLDSILTLHLIVTLEDKFDIEIDDDDLIIENLNSVEAIKRMVNKYAIS